MTPYRRLLESDYGADVNKRTRGLRVAKDGSALPNARKLSNLSFGWLNKDMHSFVQSKYMFLHQLSHNYKINGKIIDAI